MKIFPVLLDSRPSYLGHGDAPPSLLLLPMSTRTLLEHALEGLPASLRGHLTVAPVFEPGAGYEAAVRAACPAVEQVVPAARLSDHLATYEPSDWLLMVDPRCFPADGLPAQPLFDGLEERPRWVRHLVALESNAAGTRECVECDTEGRVRRIQRYYDDVTWNFALGVCCSVLPASFALLLDVPFMSLPHLRGALAARGVPSRDLRLPGDAYDLDDERDLLLLAERVVLEMTARSDGAASPASPCRPVHAGIGTRIDPSVQFVGPVVVQDGAVIEAGATLVGPALIGAGAQVRHDATVAQCVLGPAAVAAPRSVLRHRLVLVDGPEPPPASAPQASLDEGPLLRPRGPGLRGERAVRALYPRVKSLLDLVVALLAIVLLSPLLALIALAVKLTSAGPVLYRDEREGRGGRLFRCYKFRTMCQGADVLQRDLIAQNELDGPQFKLETDPRVTAVGRLLRAVSFDELAQLFNVVRGQMSLVGPRPSPFRENQLCIPWRDARLSVRPGITGLWQVCRQERKSGDFHQWIHYDLLYVRHMSFWVDLKIALATVWTLGGRGHVALTRIIPPSRLGRVPSLPARKGVAATCR